MPDPGPCALLGYTLEYKWNTGKWSTRNKSWAFLWSPKYKYIITMKMPKKLKVVNSKDKTASKIVEIFKARPAKEFYEFDMYDGPLVKLGKAKYIIYNSDKWYSNKDYDYIHDFENVDIYANRKIRPSFFVCKGGRLTITSRGIVW